MWPWRCPELRHCAGTAFPHWMRPILHSRNDHCKHEKLDTQSIVLYRLLTLGLSFHSFSRVTQSLTPPVVHIILVSQRRGSHGTRYVNTILKNLANCGIGIMYSAATISGAFSGLIAYGAVRNLSEPATGMPPWRWVYIIDGSVALLIGFMVLLFLPSFPENVRAKGKHWLFTQEELDVACQRTACKSLNKTRRASLTAKLQRSIPSAKRSVLVKYWLH